MACLTQVTANHASTTYILHEGYEPLPFSKPYHTVVFYVEHIKYIYHEGTI